MQQRTIYKPQRSSKDLLVQAIFKDASIGIVVVDRKGYIQLINPFALDLFGYTAKELIGKKIEELIPLPLRKKHISHRNSYVSHQPKSVLNCTKSDLKALRKDGVEFPAELSLGHYMDKDEIYVIAYVRDITLRKKEEEEIRQLNEKLEEKVEERTHELRGLLKKLESSSGELKLSLEKEKTLNELKSRFVTMASHEFRTPLSTVLSSAYLLEKYCDSKDQPHRKKHIDRIISSVNTLTDILNDFLSVGKIEEGKILVTLSTFDIQHFISNIIGEMKNMQKNGQHILYEHTGDKMIQLDPAILKHIVMNLLSNAIKFSNEGSLIEIRSKHTGKHFVLSVKDHGIGIPKEDIPHLFERFHRGANVTNIQGTGLGLNIVSKYSDLLNGKITCKSELEKGTEFIIKFDLKEEEKDPGDTSY